MYSKTRTKLGIIYESCKLSGRLIAPLAKVEQCLSVRHITEYVYRLASTVRYCRTRARAETVGVEVVRNTFFVCIKHIEKFSIDLNMDTKRLSQANLLL